MEDKAPIGDHATIYGINVAKQLSIRMKFINTCHQRRPQNNGPQQVVVVAGTTVKSAVGKNSVINANGDVQIIALGSTDIIDIVGSPGYSLPVGAALGASIDTIGYQGTDLRRCWQVGKQRLPPA